MAYCGYGKRKWNLQPNGSIEHINSLMETKLAHLMNDCFIQFIPEFLR